MVDEVLPGEAVSRLELESLVLADEDGEVSADEGDDLPTDSPSTVTDQRNKRRLDLLRQDEHDDEDLSEDGVPQKPRSSLESESERIIDKARAYQQELFERAKEENIIVVLGTGTGKTLIATMLIRHILDEQIVEQAANKAPKFIFFLAHSVPLVHQQARFLSTNLAVEVLALSGKGKEDLWQRSEWERILERVPVIVCTPAVLDQALFHAFVDISEISLLVFDEAHHCKKNHPYAKIIRDYYLHSSGPKPRLFGMTASPVDSKRNIADTIEDLESLLHCKIVTTSDFSLFGFAWKPKDVVWEYSQYKEHTATELYKKVLFLRDLIPELRPDFDFAWRASAELGTWFTDRILSYVVGRTEDETNQLISKLERGTVYADMVEAEDRASAVQRTGGIYDIVRSHNFAQLAPLRPLVSPKVEVLLANLRARYAEFPDTRAMVFVQQRWTAVVLYDALEDLSIPHIRPGILTGGGHLARGTISSKTQEQVLRDFHAGLVNLVFATSVGEEGIDIPQCNLVVRFDPNTTAIQYMQSRGRARMKDSIYAHMLEQDNFDHRAMMEYFIDSANYIQAFCSSLPPDRLLGRGTKLDRLVARDKANGAFKTPLGVLCNFSNCLTILSRYASSVNTQDILRTPSYEELFDQVPDQLFQYVVRIPTGEGATVKGAKGHPQTNKILARRSAAFNCVVKLRQKRLLDDNLDSVFRKAKPANHNARLAVSARKDSYDMQTKPSIWQRELGVVPQSLFALVVDIVPHGRLQHKLAPMVLLTRLPLPLFPTFPVFLETGIRADVVTSQLSQPFAVTEVEVEQLTAYTLNSIFADVFNKIYAFDARQVAYWLVPKLAEAPKHTTILRQLVDFSALQRASKLRPTWSAGDEVSAWCNQFLVDPLSGKHHYFTESVVEGKGPFDPEPKEFLPKEGKKAKPASIIYFTDSHWRVSEKEKLAVKWDRNQPVIEAQIQVVRRNFLDYPTDKEQAVAKCWIVPEPLERARLTPAEARFALLWPSVLYRLEQYLIALEAMDKLGLKGIPTGLALEAFTKDAQGDDEGEYNSSGNSNSSNSNQQVSAARHRGMGKNYERLEFLGDSLLKMTTTITVFNRTACDEEGMHCRRMAMLCNRNLFNVASSPTYDLPRYIRSQSFMREYWYPENMVLLKGRGANPKDPQPVQHAGKTHALGMKTIADVCEATIGAAVIAQQDQPLETRFDLAIRAVTVLVGSEDHAVQQWADFAPMYKPPTWQLDLGDPRAIDLATRVGRRIGYKFKYPRLLRSAFTHSSDANAPVPDLQRLEFLGDACLDWVSIAWLFATNPDRDPQWLTEHKMALVSNRFLAALAVVLDFHKFFFTPSTVKLFSDIKAYADEATELYQSFLLSSDSSSDSSSSKSNSNSSSSSPSPSPQDGAPTSTTPTPTTTTTPIGPDFWIKISKPPPKALADLVESTLGAMLIDSGFRLEPLVAFFHTHVLPFFRDISIYDGYASQHPVSYVYKKLAEEYGCLDFKVMNTDVREGSVELVITAGVLVHDAVVAKCTGSSARYAKVKASKMALDRLDGMTRNEFRERFGCNCAAGANRA
ncbi:hypothetical protein DV738_g5169, partial [Chaetothyriales sp. CBS 135597]